MDIKKKQFLPFHFYQSREMPGLTASPKEINKRRDDEVKRNKNLADPLPCSWIARVIVFDTSSITSSACPDLHDNAFFSSPLLFGNFSFNFPPFASVACEFDRWHRGS